MKIIEVPVPRVYVGSFRSIEEYRDMNLGLISISFMKPQGLDDVKSIQALAPSKKLMSDLKSKKIQRLDFSMRYRKELEDSGVTLLSIVRVLSCLNYVESKSGMILLSHEKDPMKSHRGVLAEMLDETRLLDVKVEEIG